MNEPTHLDLFSGIGGFAIAAQWAGFRTIGFCEIDKYCQKVLAKNFGAEVVANSNGSRLRSTTMGEEQSWRTETQPSSQIIPNIFDLDGTRFRGVSLITGGFPCQPFSVAGKRGGAADDRAIWPEMFRVISEARPAWVLGENVPGIIPMELDNVLSDLEGIGYATRTFVIPACAVDARHRRDRVWVVGRNISNTSDDGSNRNGSSGGDESEKSENSSEHRNRRSSGTEGLRGDISDSSQLGLEGQRKQSRGTGTQLNDTSDYCRWEPEPAILRVAHGIRNRVDRLKGLGNAIVPQVAFELLREIRKCL